MQIKIKVRVQENKNATNSIAVKINSQTKVVIKNAYLFV